MTNLLLPPLDYEMAEKIFEFLADSRGGREDLRRLAIVAWHDGIGPENARHHLGTMLSLYLREQLDTGEGLPEPVKHMRSMANAALLNFRVIEALSDRILRRNIREYREEAPPADEVLPWVDVRHFDHRAQQALAEAQAYARELEEVLATFRKLAGWFDTYGALEPDREFVLEARGKGKAKVTFTLDYAELLRVKSCDQGSAALDLDGMLVGMSEIVSTATNGKLSKLSYDWRAVCDLIRDELQAEVEEEVAPIVENVGAAGTGINEALALLAPLLKSIEGGDSGDNLAIVDRLATALEHLRLAQASLETIDRSPEEFADWGSAADAKQRLSLFQSWLLKARRKVAEECSGVGVFLDLLGCVIEDALEVLGDGKSTRHYAMVEKDGKPFPMVGQRRDCGCLEVSFVKEGKAHYDYIDRCKAHDIDLHFTSSPGYAKPRKIRGTFTLGSIFDDYSKAPPEEERDSILEEIADERQAADKIELTQEDVGRALREGAEDAEHPNPQPTGDQPGFVMRVCESGRPTDEIVGEHEKRKAEAIDLILESVRREAALDEMEAAGFRRDRVEEMLACEPHFTPGVRKDLAEWLRSRMDLADELAPLRARVLKALKDRARPKPSKYLFDVSCGEVKVSVVLTDGSTENLDVNHLVLRHDSPEWEHRVAFWGQMIAGAILKHYADTPIPDAIVREFSEEHVEGLLGSPHSGCTAESVDRFLFAHQPPFVWPEGEVRNTGPATGPHPRDIIVPTDTGVRVIRALSGSPGNVYHGVVSPDNPRLRFVRVEREGSEPRPLVIHERFASVHDWGYLGAEPSQLARDILWDVFGHEPSGEQTQDFAERVIGGLESSEGFRLSEQEVYAADAKWRQGLEGKRYRGMVMPDSNSFSVMVYSKDEHARAIGPLHPGDAPEHLRRWFEKGDHEAMAQYILSDLLGDRPEMPAVRKLWAYLETEAPSFWEVSEAKVRELIAEEGGSE